MMNLKRFRLALAWSGCALAVTGAAGAAQDAGVSPYESRFAEANGIRLQYMDFGGSGLPLIFVRDIHNYFEHEEPFFQRDLRSAFYARFTDDHRVLATVKRGHQGPEPYGSRTARVTSCSTRAARAIRVRSCVPEHPAPPAYPL